MRKMLLSMQPFWKEKSCRETSTSALAKELLESEYPVQGTAYFTYEGEKLTD